MKKLILALCVALYSLSGMSAYAADQAKAEPAKPAASKAGDKPASAAAPASAPAKKKEKKGGC